MKISRTLLLIALVAGAQQDNPEARRKQQEFNRRAIEQLTPEQKRLMEATRSINRDDWIKAHPARESTGMTALPDLGRGYYNGEQGGLYPGGVNIPPAAHLKAGRELARRIVPLDAEGRESPTGKIVLMSVGMSNTTMKFQTFQKVAQGDSTLNPRLVIVDGAQGGQVVWVTANSKAVYWDVVDERLASAGVTRKQVQAAWVLQATPGPMRPWPVEVKELQRYLVETLHVMHDRFPNLKIAYLSSRTYAGYATSPLNPEPHAYESGFALKWLIADQIAGKPELNYDPSKGPVRAPWCAWGPYVWADGTKANSAGLGYIRADYIDDGTHPSASGREKVAARLLQFLKTDSTAQPWFTGYFPPPDTQRGWRSLTGAGDDEVRKVAGMSRQKLDAAFEYAKETSQHGGLLVVRHGWLVYEKYFGRGHRDANPEMASCGKALTSVACGIMLKEKRGLIPNGLDEKVFTEKYLPEAFPLSDPSKADIKLGHLLTMTSGIREGRNLGYVRGKTVKPESGSPTQQSTYMDINALRAPQWCKPGEGYCYSTASTHVASIVLRHLTGMELQEYIDLRLAKPMQFGRWGYAKRRGNVTLEHTPGGFGIAVRSTDALRFAYLLLHQGQWNGRELVPADYVALCGRMSPYNPHYPFSLQFEVNEDGHVAGAPRDAFWKSGAGGFGIYVVPSLDLVIYKMAGTESQYDSAATGMPELYRYDGSRGNWKSTGINVDDGVRRVVEMVSSAVVD